jgi:hypothetical protein
MCIFDYSLWSNMHIRTPFFSYSSLILLLFFSYSSLILLLFFSSSYLLLIVIIILEVIGLTSMADNRPGRKYDQTDEDAFWRRFTLPEEDKHPYTAPTVRSGHRWFRSENVYPIERYRRLKEQKRKVK